MSINLAVVSLAIAGIYAVGLVILRAPIFSSLISNKDLFKQILIIHVDLSVLYWMLNIISHEIIQDINNRKNIFIQTTQNLALFSLVLVGLSPLARETDCYLNNYIPILHNVIFISGLGLFMSCQTLIAIMGLVLARSITIKAISVSIIISILSFIISAYKINFIEYELDHYTFYEWLFWGGGHLLQFVYCSGMIIIWCVLFNLDSKQSSIAALILINTLLMLPGLLVQLYYPINSSEYIDFYTQHMKYFGGLIPTIACCIIVFFYYSYQKSQSYLINSKVYVVSFWLSVLLFFVGGLLGILISGVNVTIPAHYHGGIVGITIAFMGYAYLKVSNGDDNFPAKKAITQLWLYAIGQLIHILALAYSGGYGALRKNPDGTLVYEAKIAMSVMGVGGMIAIIAGLMFVMIYAKSYFSYKRTEGTNIL